MTISGWSNLAIALVAVLGMGGSVAYMILFGMFIPRKQCEKKQNDCQKEVCKKIDALRETIRLNHEEEKANLTHHEQEGKASLLSIKASVQQIEVNINQRLDAEGKRRIEFEKEMQRSLVIIAQNTGQAQAHQKSTDAKLRELHNDIVSTNQRIDKL